MLIYVVNQNYLNSFFFFPLSSSEEDCIMARPGSTGNVLAAICSFFIPGLGQLVQGRVGMALIHFVLAGVLWFFLLGWIIHLWSIIDAALFSRRSSLPDR
jgi:TM2 domain-containing membrane protein YozV